MLLSSPLPVCRFARSAAADAYLSYNNQFEKGDCVALSETASAWLHGDSGLEPSAEMLQMLCVLTRRRTMTVKQLAAFLRQSADEVAGAAAILQEMRFVTVTTPARANNKFDRRRVEVTQQAWPHLVAFYAKLRERDDAYATFALSREPADWLPTEAPGTA